jgi:hypothetical protein
MGRSFTLSLDTPTVRVRFLLVAAVKSARFIETLQGKGPFTVFAPINDHVLLPKM